jgi:hypothetical protein
MAKFFKQDQSTPWSLSNDLNPISKNKNKILTVEKWQLDSNHFLNNQNFQS